MIHVRMTRYPSLVRAPPLSFLPTFPSCLSSVPLRFERLYPSALFEKKGLGRRGGSKKKNPSKKKAIVEKNEKINAMDHNGMAARWTRAVTRYTSHPSEL